jgi:hypothetical protein
VKALGSDAAYVDYVLPKWDYPVTPADVKLMVDDPQCLGIFGPEEPSNSPPNDPTGKVWRVSLKQWQTYWAPVIAADPGNTKVRLADFAGNKLSAAWGSYTGDDAKPYADLVTDLGTNWHPRNAYGDQRADADIYPTRAVRMLGRISPNKPRWYISECANEKLSPTGRAPTYSELLAQFNGILGEDVLNSPIRVWAWFPQEPHPSAAHVFDATTAQQFESVKQVNQLFLKGQEPTGPPPPETDDAKLILDRLDKLEKQLTDLTALVNQVREDVNRTRVLKPQE